MSVDFCSYSVGADHMKLSRFIISHIDEIVGEWETFARSLSKPDFAMPVADLQDHARQMLKAIAADMEKSESKQQKKVKSVSDVSSITGEKVPPQPTARCVKSVASQCHRLPLNFGR